MRRGLGALGIAVTLSLTLVAGAASALTKAQLNDTRWEPGEVQNARALLAHVPVAFRIDCVLDEVFEKIPVPDGVEARVDCDPLPKALGAAEVTYLQFDTTETMQAYYQQGLQTDITTPPTGCLPDAPYSIGGKATGRSACVPQSLGADIIYTYEPLRVVGVISQFQDDAGNTDIAGLYDFSNHSAGPDPEAGAIPSLLTGTQARHAAAALRSHIPSALSKHCTTDSVVATPWVAASLSCGPQPFPNVQSAGFTAYRTKAAFRFDPQAEVASSEASNATCPDSGTWTSGGHVRGRFACTFDAAGNTRLNWTLDSKLIEADATANQDGQMTSKQLLTWWDQKATLIP